MTTSTFFETVEALFHDWNYGHPKVLYGLIRALKPEIVVECGTYRGYAACYMARALQENKRGHLYCIDNFSLTDHTDRYGDAKKHLLENLHKCGVADVVTLIEGDSDKVTWPKRVDFAYVDGWHAYQTAARDFNNCAGRGATCICLDDTLNCVGPRKLVSEVDAGMWWDVITLPNDNGLTICHLKASRRVTFSQELPDNPGVDITRESDEGIRTHLAKATLLNGVDYRDFNPGGPPVTSAP